MAQFKVTLTRGSPRNFSLSRFQVPSRRQHQKE